MTVHKPAPSRNSVASSSTHAARRSPTRSLQHLNSGQAPEVQPSTSNAHDWRTVITKSTIHKIYCSNSHRLLQKYFPNTQPLPPRRTRATAKWKFQYMLMVGREATLGLILAASCGRIVRGCGT
ncbi:uncharacterized protein LOC144592991 [Rhinoraja longicauda]